MTPTSDPSPPGETDADIIERLLRAAPFMRATGNAGIIGQHANTCEEAAAVIAAARQEIALERKAKEGAEAYLCEAQAEIGELKAKLGALVEAYEQEDGLNPTVSLVQAMHDARTWLEQNT